MSNSRAVDEKLRHRAEEILQKKFSEDVTVTSTKYLSEPERRNVIVRLHLQSASNSVPASVILKQSLPQSSDADDKNAFSRFARDWAGLEFTSKISQNLHNTPHFYGSDHELRFILIEDLGEPHVSLVDTLTKNDPKKAIDALDRYVKALGSFHGASFKHTHQYLDILHKINPNATTLKKDLELTAKSLLERLSSTLKHEKLALVPTNEFLDEVNQILDGIFIPGPFTVLTHGDIAPDNVFDNEDSLQLIDFEWCGIRNALLDGTYLRMSIPTGWCAKTIPEEILNKLEKIYRQELIKQIPDAKNDKVYYEAYVQACGFHTLQQMTTVINSLEKDELWGPGTVPSDSLWDANDNSSRARCLTRLKTFIDLAEKHKMFPHIRKMATDMLTKLKILWPDAKPLDTYPAFKIKELPLVNVHSIFSQHHESISKNCSKQNLNAKH